MKTMSQLSRFIFSGVFALAVAIFQSAQSFAFEIREITSPGGIKAYLVEDHTLPIISMSFAFEGGSTLDPVGKEGTVSLMRSMLDEGAGELDSQAFQVKLEEYGIDLGFSASRDWIRGSIRTVVND